MSDNFKLLFTAQGMAQAHLIESFLASHDIDVTVIGAGAGQAFGFTVGPLGRVEIYVPTDQHEAAETLLEDYLALIAEGEWLDEDDYEDDEEDGEWDDTALPDD